MLEPVPHRHVVLTMRLLRGIFRRRRELLIDLSQCGAEALSEYLKREVGVVVSVATAGDLLQWHPHGRLLATDGAFSDDGAFHPLEAWHADAVEAAPTKRRCPPSWARLISKVYQADLDHPGLSSPEQEKLPPPGRWSECR